LTTTYIFGKISNTNKFIFKKTAITIIDVCKHLTKHDLVPVPVTKLILEFFFQALFEEKLNKLMEQLNIIRISGIRPDTGFQKGRIIRPDIRCIPNNGFYEPHFFFLIFFLICGKVKIKM
jgi:hypothetical protein